MMTVCIQPFCRVEKAFKLSVDKLLPKPDFLSLKKTEFMFNDVIRSYGWLILSETTFRSAQEYSDYLVLQQSTDIILFCIY